MDTAIIQVLFGTLAILLLIGAPISVGLGVSALATMWYLGDNPIRDVEGTRAAGFGMMILFEEPATLAKEPQTGDLKPDYAIKETRQLLDIFPARE